MPAKYKKALKADIPGYDSGTSCRGRAPASPCLRAISLASVPVALGVPLEGTSELGIASPRRSRSPSAAAAEVLPIAKPCDQFAKNVAQRLWADLVAAGVSQAMALRSCSARIRGVPRLPNCPGSNALRSTVIEAFLRPSGRSSIGRWRSPIRLWDVVDLLESPLSCRA